MKLDYVTIGLLVAVVAVVTIDRMESLSS